MTTKFNSHRFCIAPMMDWTDKHCRYFHRLLTKQALLYTEMVTAGALIHGDSRRYLSFNPEEHPVALQLGGSDPHELATCAKMAEDAGYDEVNLNIGCPSERVQNGRFGACLMLEPELVAECVSEMSAKVAIPVTVKTRIGVDNNDSYAALVNFIQLLAQAGCHTFIIHARKAWLSGLSPKQNRDIPPLRYDVVVQLKNDCPDLNIIINGGITGLDDAKTFLTQVDGVMLGREAYHNPYLLAYVDSELFGEKVDIANRIDIVERLLPYIDTQLNKGHRLNNISRHILGLFNGLPGARSWRRHLSENAAKPDASTRILREALAFVEH
jgi:tRNA-dihydrouridine synthase A